MLPPPPLPLPRRLVLYERESNLDRSSLNVFYNCDTNLFWASIFCLTACTSNIGDQCSNIQRVMWGDTYRWWKIFAWMNSSITMWDYNVLQNPKVLDHHDLGRCLSIVSFSLNPELSQLSPDDLIILSTNRQNSDFTLPDKSSPWVVVTRWRKNDSISASSCDQNTPQLTIISL